MYGAGAGRQKTLSFGIHRLSLPSQSSRRRFLLSRRRMAAICFVFFCFTTWAIVCWPDWGGAILQLCSPV